MRVCVHAFAHGELPGNTDHFSSKQNCVHPIVLYVISVFLSFRSILSRHTSTHTHTHTRSRSFALCHTRTRSRTVTLLRSRPKIRQCVFSLFVFPCEIIIECERCGAMNARFLVRILCTGRVWCSNTRRSVVIVYLAACIHCQRYERGNGKHRAPCEHKEIIELAGG